MPAAPLVACRGRIELSRGYAEAEYFETPPARFFSCLICSRLRYTDFGLIAHGFSLSINYYHSSRNFPAKISHRLAGAATEASMDFSLDVLTSRGSLKLAASLLF